MKQLIALFLLASLSGCWTGPDFYAGEPSRQPIAPGRYVVVDAYAMKPDVERSLLDNEPIGGRTAISYTNDGYVLVDNQLQEGGPSQARIITLDEARGLYIVQVDPGEGQVRTATQIYGLLAVFEDGYRLSVPPCDGTRRLGPNSPVIVSGLLFGLNCRFKDRESFEIAMRNFADDPVSWTQYRRVE